MRLLVLLMLCFSIVPAWAGKIADKKLIEYGWDVPNPAYVREHIEEMEKIPFDGVVIRLDHPRKDEIHHSAGFYAFSKDKLLHEHFVQDIEDLKATKFKRFTDNFIQVTVHPGDVDWFDPEWSIIADNVACLARVAKQGGCVGIMFDPEMYGKQLWSYQDLPPSVIANSSFEDYAVKVRERGREFMRAVNKEFPDITILCLFGYSLPWVETRVWNGNVPLSEAQDGLLAAFYDGMLDVATPETVMVDGYEFSYGYRTRKEFRDARKLAMKDARALAADPKKFDSHMRMGYGVWADWDSGRIGYHTDDFTKNYFTPAGLRASLNYALEESDGYVWVYSERLKWWPCNAPKDYIDVLALAKSGPGPGEPNPLDPESIVLKASSIPGLGDEPTFAEMLETMTEIFDFPKDGWRFQKDQQNTGTKLGWHRAEFDNSSWETISIGKFWEEQIGPYDGRAWYRTSFTSPSIESGKRVFIAFGAVDEGARVWLNGRFIAERDIGGRGWDRPFAMEITHVLKRGQENVLAVQVIDRVKVGGIWKSVKLMVK